MVRTAQRPRTYPGSSDRVLSEHAGTAEKFPDLVLVNAFDIEATPSAIRWALETDRETGSALPSRKKGRHEGRPCSSEKRDQRQRLTAHHSSI